MPQRPTTLKLMARHCPRAIDHYEAGAPMDRRIFGEGTAAHDVLHALALEQDVDQVVAALITTGRGGVDAEPPLSPDAVFRGRDLALVAWDWLGGLPEGGHAEVGLAFTDAWEPVSYTDERAWFRTRLDVLYPAVHVEDEFEARGIAVRDYKSAWPTDETELDTIQIRAQAVAAALTWRKWLDDEPAFVRREVVNLRTRQVFEATTWLDDDGWAEIERWCDDLDTLVRAASSTPRRAAPGVGCVGCPYVLVCEDARLWGRLDLPLNESPDIVVESYAAAKARADQFEALAREITKDTQVEVAGGLVGYVRKEQAAAADDAPAGLWDAWTRGHDVPPDAASLGRGLLGALGLGATQVRNAAKALFPARTQKAERDAFAATLLDAKPTRRWGIWPRPTQGDS